jgi:hypothetical protein
VGVILTDASKSKTNIPEICNVLKSNVFGFEKNGYCC